MYVKVYVPIATYSSPVFKLYARLVNCEIMFEDTLSVVIHRDITSYHFYCQCRGGEREREREREKEREREREREREKKKKKKKEVGEIEPASLSSPKCLFPLSQLFQ